MRSSHLKVSVDNEADAAYVSLSGRPVSRTVQFSPSILIDMDDMDMVVGIEILTLSAKIDLDLMAREFHLASDVEALLRGSIRSRSTFSVDSSAGSATSQVFAAC